MKIAYEENNLTGNCSTKCPNYPQQYDGPRVHSSACQDCTHYGKKLLFRKVIICNYDKDGNKID